MNLAVNSVEAVWLGINLFSAIVTLSNLVDAFAGWRAVAGTSVAWRVQARANLRSEIVRLVTILALLIVVLPAITRPGDTPVTLSLVVFMAVPAGIALNGYLDRRTRRTLERLVAE
jgi:hypothetical protein